MTNSWKTRIYDNYVTNTLGDAHSGKRDMQLQCKYYQKNYAKYLPTDKKAKILELGSGMGQFYYFLLKSGYHNYEGIDLSEENISYVKKHVNPKANIFKRDILDFLHECKEGQYDVVIFNDVIEHLKLEEIFEVMDGVRKILKKGGVFLIKTLNMANPFVGPAGRYIVIDHEIGFTEVSMRELLRACGYRNIRIVGTDVYVLNPLISIPAKAVSKVINCILYILSLLYGRKTIKIFDKDILAIAYK